jgi:hypothetical protein
MVGTFISIIIAALFFIYQSSLNGLHESGWLPLVFILIPALFLFGQTLIMIFALAPLQRAEVKLTSHIVDTFSKDSNLKLTNFGLLVFLFISVFFAVDYTVLKIIPPALLLIVWTISLGIAIDLKIHTIHRVLKYLNPFVVTDMFTQNAFASIRNSDDLALCSWIDSLTETAIKAIDRKSTSLSIHAMNKLGEVIKTYLETEKSLSHSEETEAKQFGVSDPVSFMLFFIFQRMELINHRAIHEKLEPLCSDLMALLGKIAIYATQFDVTLTSFPIHYMGKFAAEAQANKLQEVAERATFTLLEVGKAIVQEKNLQYLDIKDPFLSIINHMDEIAKETFRKNKETNIKLLIQPFKDLKNLFTEENVVNHRDTHDIIKSIDRVIEEFSTLESVIMAMPPVTQIVPPKKDEGTQETKGT